MPLRQRRPRFSILSSPQSIKSPHKENSTHISTCAVHVCPMLAPYIFSPLSSLRSTLIMRKLRRIVSKNASSSSSSPSPPPCAGDRSVEQRVAAKGYVPVVVGVGEEAERFVVNVKVFRHQCMVSLLEMAAQEFGFEQKGVLRIPCDVQQFRRVLQQISD